MALLSVLPSLAGARSLYVAPPGSSTNGTAPYTNWAMAATNLAWAVGEAVADDVIWVTNGVYSLTNQIVLSNGISVFSVNGATKTLVNGNNYAGKSVTNRCFFLTHSNAVLSGFTIVNGVATGASGVAASGGGVLLTHGVVQNCIIQSNLACRGGGVAIYTNGIVRNCLIESNANLLIASASPQGGGVLIAFTGYVQNCTIVRNGGMNLTHGGGIAVSNGGFVFNSLIVSNFASTTNINWTNNTAAAVYSNNCSFPSLAAYGGNNISANIPGFISYSDRNYRLTSNSVCVNQGLVLGWMNSTTMDLVNNPRLIGPLPDIGAYEQPFVFLTLNTNVMSYFLPQMSVVIPSNVFVTNVGVYPTNIALSLSMTNLTPQASNAWLTSAVSQFTLSAGQTAAVPFSISAAQMQVGNVWSGRVSMVIVDDALKNYDGVMSNTLTVVVTCAVPAMLAISTNAISRSVLEAQNASDYPLEVWNAGQNPDGSYLRMAYSNTVFYTNCGIYTNWITRPTNGVSQGEHRSIWLRFDTATLPPRTAPYVAYLRVDGFVEGYGGSVSNSPQYVEVQMSIQAKPRLLVTPSTRSQRVTMGHDAAGQTLQLSNTSSVPQVALSYGVLASTFGAWSIGVSPSNGVVLPGSTGTVSLIYNTASLSPGVYTGQVTVSTSVEQVSVPVFLSVSALPTIQCDVTNLAPATMYGSTPVPLQFHVRNGSVAPRGALRYILSDDASWLSLSPSLATSTGEWGTVTASCDVTGLAPGVYSATATIAGFDDSTGDSMGTLTFPVQLKLYGFAELSLNASSISPPVSVVLANETVTNTFLIVNAGAFPQGLINFTIMDDVTWLSIKPAAGTASNVAQAVSVVFSAGTLAPGDYAGSIVVDAIDSLTGRRALGAPVNMSVSMTVASREPGNYDAPQIYGLPYVGQTLTASPGVWQNSGRLSWSYQWQRANNSAASGLISIPGATSSVYVVLSEDRGKFLRVAVTAVDAAPTPVSTTAYSGFSARWRVKAMPNDFNGDGLGDLWFYDAFYGMWRAALSDQTTASAWFGGLGMTAVPGDYNGDGALDIGVFDPASGTWYIWFLPSGRFASGQLGWRDTIPVPGDYDGDGATDAAVYWPAGGMWYVLKSSTWQLMSQAWGDAVGVPAPEDYDGDGITDFAMFSAGQWRILTSQGQQVSDVLGGSGTLPAPGDYDGDSRADLGVYYPSNNFWRVKSSANSVIQEGSFGAGNGTGVPIQGYYDHDPYCDATVMFDNGDFFIWNMRLSTDVAQGLIYRGQSYQWSQDRWRVTW